MDATQAAKYLSIPTAFLLSGYFFNSSQNTAPILLHYPASVSTAIFKPFYYNGLAVVAPAGVIASTAFGYLAYTSKETSKRNMYVAGAILSFGILPWTKLVMATGIERLIEISGESAMQLKADQSGEALKLLKAWTAQNWVRAALTFSSGMVGLVAAFNE